MARQQVRKNRNVQYKDYQRENYVDGATARKLQAVPDYADNRDYDDDYDYAEEESRHIRKESVEKELRVAEEKKRGQWMEYH